ncbi:MAG TPA: PPC domain-containing DNA-binding protein [Burkholderiales bacterium]|nr:PPC domain-containing DNA-binding protein [Burkholderiales bacterium]
MRAKLLNAGPERTYALIFDKGDEPVSLISAFAKEHKIGAARLSAIGAFSEVVLGYFDWEKKDYKRIPLREQVEVLSLLGDIALGEKGEPKLHAHVVLGKRDGTAHGGHLLEGRVRPTLEVLLIQSPAALQKVHDPETGLALIHIGK